MNDRAVSLSSTAQDLLALTKPRLSSLVLATAGGGIWLAPGNLGVSRGTVALLATAGIVGSANALNCYLERDSDRYMTRTRNRPLPAGRMEPPVALQFGLWLVALSLPALAFATNLLTAALGLLAFVSYVFVYTPVKAKSHLAVLVGAVPGALPPLMGWTAVTGRLEVPGLMLFAILFLWQVPHFIAISLFRKDDYAAAGLKSLPLARGDEVARLHILAYLAVLVPVSQSLYWTRVAGPVYLFASLVLGVGFLALGIHGFVHRLGRPWARQLFFYSLVYLSGLFAVLWLDGGPARL